MKKQIRYTVVILALILSGCSNSHQQSTLDKVTVEKLTDQKIDTQVENKPISQHDIKQKVKLDLPESKRQEIFRASVKAEKSAYADSERLYPLPDPLKPGYSSTKASAQVRKQTEALSRLTEEYNEEVIDLYDITKEQLWEISGEGIEKNWPRQ